jgi:hypothetical protein
LRATRRRAAKPAPSPLVVRIHEATGSAKSGWDAALKAAVKDARAEVSEPIVVEITRHVSVKVAYRQPIAGPKRRRKKAAS